ncbi:Hypothetical protein R9X50_00229500 [Acrodontium crateriforme]|uniref:Pre-mRNA-processing protein prp40 n=1 Tax=Acrodontium crateriforme TaxID=150365 RepID=A0AAQ3R3D5_9PEZI|nr:Hypothetical protein R9X50_00229500 [Acrodontium crateriforme]
MALWAEAKAPDGRTYYYHSVTKQTSWTKPDDFDGPATPAAVTADQAAIDAAWKATNTAEGKTYYYNAVTRETTWETPKGFVKEEESAAPVFVAGGGLPGYGSGDKHGSSERRMERREDRGRVDRYLPQKPNFEGGRGQPWENRQDRDNMGFRGPMPAKNDEPEYATGSQAEDAFFKLLKKHGVTPDMKWEEALRLVIREREFRALKDPRERKEAFAKYCVEVRAQEKQKEKDRKQKMKEDFRKMLQTHDDIKYYTRWKTARPKIEREAVFKSASDDTERRAMFDEYIRDLKIKHADEEARKHQKAVHELGGLLQALIVDPMTNWREAHSRIVGNSRFKADETFKSLNKYDMFTAYEYHVKILDEAANEAKQRNNRMKSRRDRQARDAYKQLLSELHKQGRIKIGTKWKDIAPLVIDDPRTRAFLTVPGSSAIELFWDILVEEENKLRSLRNEALDVLEEKRFEMTLKTAIEEFAKVMRSDRRTATLDEETMLNIYNRLMEKIKRRVENEKQDAERQQRRAIDSLRSVIKHLEPAVRIGDTYEDVAPRLQSYEEFKALDDDEARRSAFEKHIRRLKEREEELERDRARRDRDHRNAPRRDYERDRRHRSRTPEADSYEADRRKAQADRERSYRKASFGLTPPPRDRRDDRYDRDRRGDRRDTDGMSVYDRERREREMERERSYVSRADPRDKGRTLDYGDEDAVGSHPGSVRKRADSDVSNSSRRSNKRPRRMRTRTPEVDPKEEPPALQSGSEEGEIEEV